MEANAPFSEFETEHNLSALLLTAERDTCTMLKMF